jgi:hypothetical protein
MFKFEAFKEPHSESLHEQLPFPQLYQSPDIELEGGIRRSLFWVDPSRELTISAMLFRCISRKTTQKRHFTP